MRTPFVQVAVVRLGANGKVEARYPEVGPYVVAAPGLPYSVVVRLSSALPATGRYQAASHSCRGSTCAGKSKVDGRNVGATYIIRAGAEAALFKGFVERADATAIEYRQFVFAKLAEDAHVAAQLGPGSQAGTMEVEVWQVVAAGTRDVVQPTVNDLARQGPKVAAPPDGKKFFEAPSLTTGVGGVTRGAGFSKTRYARVQHGPIARVELRYETAATLVLRGVLDPEGDPQHKRIVDKYAFFKAEDDVKVEGEGEGAASSSGRQAAAAAAAPRPAKRARLAPVPQAGGQQAGAQQAGDELIEELLQDLKGDPDEEDEPLDPVLQELLCDLTNEDAPEWQARERVQG